MHLRGVSKLNPLFHSLYGKLLIFYYCYFQAYYFKFLFNKFTDGVFPFFINSENVFCGKEGFSNTETASEQG